MAVVLVIIRHGDVAGTTLPDSVEQREGSLGHWQGKGEEI